MTSQQLERMAAQNSLRAFLARASGKLCIAAGVYLGLEAGNGLVHGQSMVITAAALAGAAVVSSLGVFNLHIGQQFDERAAQYEAQRLAQEPSTAPTNTAL